MKFSVLASLLFTTSTLSLPATTGAIEEGAVSLLKKAENAALAVKLENMAHLESSVLKESAASGADQITIITRIKETAGSIKSFLQKVTIRRPPPPPPLPLHAEDPAVTEEIAQLQSRAAELAEKIHAKLDPMVAAANTAAEKAKPSVEKMTSEIRMAPADISKNLEKIPEVIKDPHPNPNIASSLDATKSIIQHLEQIQEKLSQAQPILDKASQDILELAKDSKTILQVLIAVFTDLKLLGAVMFGAGGAAIVSEVNAVDKDAEKVVMMKNETVTGVVPAPPSAAVKV